jgi:hypothetical protein
MKKALVASMAILAVSGCAQLGIGEHGGSGGTDGWVTLFDGTSLSGWRQIGDANWRLENGAVVADKGNGFLATTREYSDFDLRVEFYAEPDTNSGLYLRCDSADKMLTATICYEVNIWDTRPAPEYGTGAIVDVAKVNPMPKAAGKWNVYEVTMRGDHLVVVLNGQKTADVHNAKHSKGVVALQSAPGNNKEKGSPIKFRKVQIRGT